MDELSIFKCPVCGKPILQTDKAFKCENRHSYDISSSGYVNLAMNQSGKTHGDDTLMVAARRAFLNGGYYLPLQKAICEALEGTHAECVLDAGCGEGYYTQAMGNAINGRIYGIDISKKAVTYACKSCKGSNFGTFCVGSVYDMPYCDGAFDCIVNIFSPLADGEYSRVLKNGGYLILAVPNSAHLIELKKAVYDDVRIKDEACDDINGFELIGKKRVAYTFTPENTEDITNLFSMTPYYYTTPQSKREKLKSCGIFPITADFSVITYKKK